MKCQVRTYLWAEERSHVMGASEVSVTVAATYLYDQASSHTPYTGDFLVWPQVSKCSGT